MNPDFDGQVFELAIRFGRTKLRDIADYIEWFWRRSPAVGMYDGAITARHLWDEYCHAQEDGCADTEAWAWDYELTRIIQARASMMSADEQAFLNLAARYDHGEEYRDAYEPFVLNLEFVEQGVVAALRSSARRGSRHLR